MRAPGADARGSTDPAALALTAALGVLLYRLVRGHYPFLGPDLASLCFQILQEAPPSLEGTDGYPATLADVVARCLAKEPSCRPDGLRQVVRELYPDTEIPELPRAQIEETRFNALAAYDRGEHEKAEELLEDCLRLDPHDALAAHNLAVVMLDLRGGGRATVSGAP